MTNQPDDGGHAFPSAPALPFSDGLRQGEHGMSLRDYFAGQGLASIMRDRAIWDATASERLDIATRMYEWADAMLIARKAKP